MGGTASVGSGSSTSIVTGSASSFEIQFGATPTAYTVYWNGVVPICGGDGPYAGGLTAAGSSLTFPISLTVESGDLINDDASRTTASLTANGRGSFSGTHSCSSGCAAPVTFTITVTGATKTAAGRRVLNGIAVPASDNAGWKFVTAARRRVLARRRGEQHHPLRERQGVSSTEFSAPRSAGAES